MASRMSAGSVPVCPFLIQLHDDVPRKAVEDGMRTQTPVIHMRDLVGVPGSWLQPGTALDVVGI